jgi:hypothetical protein
MPHWSLDKPAPTACEFGGEPEGCVTGEIGDDDAPVWRRQNSPRAVIRGRWLRVRTPGQTGRFRQLGELTPTS